MKAGDYVRTKDGLIRKIIEIDKLIYIDKGYISNEPEYHNSLIEEKIIKSSTNIIDLIEVGDYVNGCLVSEIKDKWLILNYADIETYEQLERKNENIKSIVTHEQFERMQYNLESEVN